MSSRSLVAVLSLLLFGCEGSHSVVIDLITDLEPGVELHSVRTEILHPGGGAMVSTDVAFGEDFIGGRRIAELSGVASGSTTTRVFLEGPEGETALTRTIIVQVAGDTGFTVVATRSCLSVVCPAPMGAPTHSTCVGGRCVDQRCTVESNEYCGVPGCMTDTDCGAASVPCARQVCVAGECLQEGLDAMCSPGEYCDLTTGCAVAPGVVDGGVDPPDASGATLITFGEDGTADVSGVTFDTTLSSSFPTQSAGDNPSVEIEAGVSTALLRFDISSIATTSTVVSAELEVWTNFSPSQGGMANVYAASEAWDEASATWQERASGMPWSTPGADGGSRGVMLGSITTTNEMFFESLESRLPIDPAVVQAWISRPSDNHGFIIAPVSGYVGLLSSEAVLFENAPILHVQHSAM